MLLSAVGLRMVFGWGRVIVCIGELEGSILDYGSGSTHYSINTSPSEPLPPTQPPSSVLCCVWGVDSVVGLLVL